MNITNLNTEDSHPSASFVNFISNLSFDKAYNDAHLSGETPQMVKVGEMSYRVMDTDSENLFYKQENVLHHQKDQTSENLDQQLYEHSDYITPLLQLTMIPVQPEHFLSHLPVHTAQFIKDLAIVLKQYNFQSKSIDYHFRFAALELNVICSRNESKLNIVIQIGDEKLQKEFCKSNQESMIAFLRSKLDTDDISVDFDFVQSTNHQQDQDSQNENDEQDVNKQQESSSNDE